MTRDREFTWKCFFDAGDCGEGGVEVREVEHKVVSKTAIAAEVKLLRLIESRGNEGFLIRYELGDVVALEVEND